LCLLISANDQKYKGILFEYHSTNLFIAIAPYFVINKFVFKTSFYRFNFTAAALDIQQVEICFNLLNSDIG